MKKKGRLKEWLKKNGKNALGNSLDLIGESTSIPFVSNLLEGIGESLSDDPELSAEQLQEAQELIKLTHEERVKEIEAITQRWESDNEQELLLPKLVRPIVLLYSWLIITLILVAEYFGVELKSADTVITMAELVNLAYFGSRGYEKIIKHKNKRK